jgi:hypothetical protein
MTTPLPHLHTAAEVADALGFSEEYVKRLARRREWPSRRGPRGRPMFSDSDVAQILELIAAPVIADEPSSGLSFAPRSRRRSA